MVGVATTAGAEAPSAGITARRRVVQTTMPDGVALWADLYGAGDTPRPLVLERTPYGRGRTDQSERFAEMAAPLSRQDLADRFVAEGFVMMVQDCRGTGASEGRFAKYLQEAGDTAATIAWARNEPWCDGIVAMVGFSYGSACQMAGLGSGLSDPDAVVADCGGFSDAHASGIRQGGAFALKQATWAYAQAVRDARARGDTDALEALAREDVVAWLRAGPWVRGHSPLRSAPDHEENLAAFWQTGEWGPFWNRPGLRLPARTLAKTTTRVMLVTSWHDTSLRSTLDNHAALCAPGAACPPPSLIIGPWSHGDRWSTVSGETDFGPESLPEVGLGGTMLDLRGAHLRGEAPPAPVRWFEMGGGSGRRTLGRIDHGGRWRSCQSWPPGDVVDRGFAISGDMLSETAVGTAMARTFPSDPDDPMPTLGGAINSGAPVMEGGMWDQRALDHRRDVLRFATPPLPRDLVIAGPIRAEIFVSADTPDFDLAVKLVDVYPDGPALNLSDGIARARFQADPRRETLVPPGTRIKLTVTLNPVGARVAATHRLRLDVAGANFPCFDVNPQTGTAQGVPGPRRKAHITIHSAPDARSRLVLATLPQARCLPS